MLALAGFLWNRGMLLRESRQLEPDILAIWSEGEFGGEKM